MDKSSCIALNIAEPSRSGRDHAVAAHEAGHALQHANNYALMGLRSFAVPMAQIGSGIGAMVASLGVFLVLSSIPAGRLVLMVGIVLYAGVVTFQLITASPFSSHSRT